MNRRYTREEYLELVRRLRARIPDLSLSTDILVGFPGETEAEFEETLSLMEEVRFLYAYMYHYNPREGSAAARLGGRIGEEVKRARLARVIALQKIHTRALLRARLGGVEEALVERRSRKGRGELLCRTERDEMVVTAGDASLAGQFITVRLLELRGNTLWGVRE
jgi:tRNA-2-methylthio-N6-dimethylallyladenosine synthase